MHLQSQMANSELGESSSHDESVNFVVGIKRSGPQRGLNLVVSAALDCTLRNTPYCRGDITVQVPRQAEYTAAGTLE